MMSNKVRPPPPRNGNDDDSNDCNSNRTRNHRFNTVHAPVFMKPPAAVVAGLSLRACTCACALVAAAAAAADSISGRRASSRSPSVFP